MKYLFIATLISFLACSCSKEPDEPKQESGSQVVEDPQSNYGKAMKRAEDTVQKIEQDRKENAELLGE